MQAILYHSDNNSYVPQTLFKYQDLRSVDQQCFPCVMQEGSSALDLHALGAGHAEGHAWDAQDYSFLQKPHAPCASDSQSTSGIRAQCMNLVEQNKGNDVSGKMNGTRTNGFFFKNVYPWMRQTHSTTASHNTPSSCQPGLKTFLLRNRRVVVVFFFSSFFLSLGVKLNNI